MLANTRLAGGVEFMDATFKEQIRSEVSVAAVNSERPIGHTVRERHERSEAIVHGTVSY